VNKYLHLILVIILLFLSQHVFAGIHGPDTYIRLCTTIIQQQTLNCPQGDLTGDCKVTIEDLAVFASQWTSGAGSPADFVGGDGVNFTDFSVLAENWLIQGFQDCPQGDLTGDCEVNFEDLVEFTDQWLAGTCSPADFVGGDGVNFTDFSILAREWLTKGYQIVISEIILQTNLWIYPAGTSVMVYPIRFRQVP